MKRTMQKSLKHTQKADWKRELAAMSPEQRREWNERRLRTAKSGVAKRQRERANGAPMESRTHEGVRKRFVTPFVHPSSEFARWLRDMQWVTA